VKVPSDHEVLAAVQRRAKNGELPTDAALVASKVNALGCIYVWTLVSDSGLFDVAKAEQLEAWWMAAKDKRLQVPVITSALAPLVAQHGYHAVLAGLWELGDAFERAKGIELQSDFWMEAQS
jgi:hypothetical protein